MAYQRMITEEMSSVGGGSSAAAAAAYTELEDKAAAAAALTNIASPKTMEPIHHYDAHGQRAPYKEGAYVISRDKDGRVMRRRWCTYTAIRTLCFSIDDSFS